MLAPAPVMRTTLSRRAPDPCMCWHTVVSPDIVSGASMVSSRARSWQRTRRSCASDMRMDGRSSSAAARMASM
eukprot:7055116-Prorocentrum_lima.AAC.1